MSHKLFQDSKRKTLQEEASFFPITFSRRNLTDSLDQALDYIYSFIDYERQRDAPLKVAARHLLYVAPGVECSMMTA